MIKDRIVPKVLLLLLISSFASTLTGQKVVPTSPYWQQTVNFKIDVSLNDLDNTLDGFEVMEYSNHSPDTLNYIWIHLWPNAFKSDRTAYSDQALENGRTDFYFSSNENRGYINRLNFKVNGIVSRLEDHPQFSDIAKLILPTFLLPGKSIIITTPFHEKLQYNFSRGGHIGQSYQVTQWYPKPAVYDRTGWHPLPYLDQGEFYAEFGNFEVNITLPANYIVGGTGELQGVEENNWLLRRSKDVKVQMQPLNNSTKFLKNKSREIISSSTETKRLTFKQDNIHDFAWFADKSYIADHDTLQLPSGRIIDVFSFYPPSSTPWRKSIQFMKDAVKTRSEWLGEYPYNVIKAWETPMGFPGGMEYPTITSISPGLNEKELDLILEHEVGHNWNYGILATNERDHPWMDEGINTYFDMRYSRAKYGRNESISLNPKSSFLLKRRPEDPTDLAYRTLITSKTDQPIETNSIQYSDINYNLIAYYKAGKWMNLLENYLGKQVFDSALHEYYKRWKFKHPYPEDFKQVVENVSSRNLDSIFKLLTSRGAFNQPLKKDIKVMAFGSLRETEKHNYVFFSPAIGYNYYDKLMIGGVLHNFTLPIEKFNYFLAPMYATGSKIFLGLGRLQYTWHSYKVVQKTELAISAASFSTEQFIDSVGNKMFLGVRKIVPSLKIVFRKTPRSSVTNYLQWKLFLLQEDGILFTRDTIHQQNIISYPTKKHYLNQLSFVTSNNRVLYPYYAEVQAEQSKDFIRTTLNANYFFNYQKGGGFNVRLFAGKFFYLGDKTYVKQFETDRYQFNMTGPKGYEDYTYSNYFVGRNEFEGFRSQQIMIRDGGFKVRTDLLASKVGKTDDWLAALNVSTVVPETFNPLAVLPIKIPFKLFLDIGTYAEAWKQNAPTGKFVYDAGVQFSLLDDWINIYLPVFYSKVYSDYIKSTITSKRFLKNISFSIDIQKINHLNFMHHLL